MWTGFNLFYIFIFLFGLFVGSFLNCVIYRLEKKESFLRGRSYCPRCKHILSWYDLIPVLSFLILKGKCRYCQEKISIQYPLVEIATGMLFLLIFNLQFSIFNQFTIYNFLNFLYLLLNSCFLIIIFVYDLKHYIIPDKVIFPAVIIVLLFNLFLNSNDFLKILLTAILASSFFLLIFLISQGKWLGFGDVKLVFFMGLLLGWPRILAALFFAFFIGAIIGLGLIIFRKKGLKSEIPFGPFLVTGTFIALFFGQNLINWYLNLFIL